MKLPASHRRAKSAAVGIKALLLVALVWGLIYPGLLWGLGHMLAS